MAAEARTAVLVEGESDRAAVLATAAATGVSLSGVDVVAMGGITNTARHVAELGRGGRGLRLLGLYDAAEERFVRRGLERAGYGTGPSLAARGFHRCDADLEEELIRALGPGRVLEVVQGQRDDASLRALQQQPAQRERSVEQQLHRFFGAGSGRKLRYAALLARAAGADPPAPLRELLDDVVDESAGLT